MLGRGVSASSSNPKGRSRMSTLQQDSLRKKRRKSISYAKWGYIFILPFFIVYIICSLIPQFLTVYNSFFENFRSGLRQIGPNYVGFKNYETLFTRGSNGEILVLKYMGNTMLMWVMGAIPQIVIALILAVWFTSYRLKIKGQAFFKTVIYMPNLIMASAFSMLFANLFSSGGPINQMLMEAGILDQPFQFFDNVITTRSLIALMNFLMWFGNTTILLMAGIMGIDQSIFEAATIDGAKSMQVFFKVTLPLLMPIIVYVVITAMIGGIQMYDVPQVLTGGEGQPLGSTMTMVMQLNKYMGNNKNYGMGGALSVVIFIFTAILSVFVYKSMAAEYSTKAAPQKKYKKKGAKRA